MERKSQHCPRCDSESYSWDDPDVQECSDCGYTEINNSCPDCGSAAFSSVGTGICPDCGFIVSAGWGGKREGAGRPPSDNPKVKTSVSLSPQTLELLEQLASSRSEAIEKLSNWYKTLALGEADDNP